MSARVMKGSNDPILPSNYQCPLPKQVKTQPVARLFEIVHMADNMPMV